MALQANSSKSIQGEEKRMKKRDWCVAFGIIIMLMAMGSGTAFAVVHTWDGGGGNNNFSTDANWDSDQDVSAVWAPGDSFNFPNIDYTTINPIVDEAYTNVGGMAINTTTSAFQIQINANMTFQTGQSISVLAGGNAATFLSGAGTIIAGGALTINNSSTNTLFFWEGITGAGANPITFTGSSDIALMPTAPILDGTNTPVTVNMDNQLDIVSFYGSNTFAGQLTLTQGYITLRHVTAFGTGAGGISLNSGILEAGTAINAAAWTPAITMTGNANIRFAGGSSEIDRPINNGGNLLTISGGSSGEISGVISGAGGLTLDRIGMDAITLSGINTYDGATVINLGTLLINAVMDDDNDGGFTVGNNSVLGGTGTIKGDTTILAGGTCKPGDAGVGTLNTLAGTAGNGNVEFQGTAKLLVDNTGGTYDVLAVGGNLTLPGGNTALLELEAGYSYTTSNAIVTVAGTYAVANQFSTASLPANWGRISTANTGVSLTYIAPAVATIPTLNEWGMIIMSLLLAVTAIHYIRKKNDDGFGGLDA